jgi:hypothetical protein
LIQRNDFEKWDLAHVSFEPDHMSAAQFYREILDLYNRILFRPRVILDYLIRYRPLQLFKMIKGARRVTVQYEKKIREANKTEPLSHA